MIGNENGLFFVAIRCHFVATISAGKQAKKGDLATGNGFKLLSKTKKKRKYIEEYARAKAVAIVAAAF